MFRRILVGDNERVLLIRKKRFADILAPGEYWIAAVNNDPPFHLYNLSYAPVRVSHGTARPGNEVGTNG